MEQGLGQGERRRKTERAAATLSVPELDIEFRQHQRGGETGACDIE